MTAKDATGRRPSDGLVDPLERLAFDETAVERLAAACPDRRLTTAKSVSVLRRELLELFLAAVDAVREPEPVPFDTALCLLPRHALLAHLIRRAAPLAIWGVRTTVGLPASATREDVAGLRGFVEKAGLGHMIEVSSASCHDLVSCGRHETVVVTGRPDTVEAIKRKTPRRVIGATGRCSVLIAGSREEGISASNALSKHRAPASCSRLAAVLVRENGDATHATTLGGRRVDLKTTLERLHPGILLTTSDAYDSVEIHGYAVLPCGPDGAVGRVRGFGRDPRHRWPGDYVRFTQVG